MNRAMKQLVGLTCFIVVPLACAAEDRTSAFFCADLAAENAQLVVVSPTDAGAWIYPGRHAAVAESGSFTWSADGFSFVLQPQRLVSVGVDTVSTVPCIDVTTQLQIAAETAVTQAPELLSALQHDKLTSELRATQMVNVALQAQLDDANSAPNTLVGSDLCQVIVQNWSSGGANTLIAAFGAKTSKYVLACKG